MYDFHDCVCFKQKTAYEMRISDWSSDVCSSDLLKGDAMLGEALRLIRVYHDLKQKQAAERLEVSTSYLSEIERGLKTPTLDIIQRYATVFDMPVSSIMFFSENLDQKSTLDQARTFVAGKVVGLLQFLRSERKSTRLNSSH